MARKRKDVMLATPFSESRFNKWSKPVIVQPKIEGDRCRAVIDDLDIPTLYSSSSREIESVPHINELLDNLHLPEIELDGELYRHRMPHEEIRSRVSRTVGLHSDYKAIEYYVFDIIDSNSQKERIDRLITNVPLLTSKVQVTPSFEAYTLEDVEYWLNFFIEQGYEGIILRDPTALYKRSAPGHATCIMKLKPRLEGVYEIISYEEEHTTHGEAKDALGALVLALPNSHKVFKVGTGFTREERINLWKLRDTLLGREVVIRYQSLTEDRKVPKMSSFVRLED